MSSVDATELLNFERKLAGLSREKLALEQRVQELTAELQGLHPVVASSGTPVNHLVEAARTANEQYEQAIAALAAAAPAFNDLIQQTKPARQRADLAVSTLLGEMAKQSVGDSYNVGSTHKDESLSIHVEFGTSVRRLDRAVAEFLSCWGRRTTQPAGNAAQDVSAD